MTTLDAPTRTPTVALVGNPNSGKTTLFNALTGLGARTGNYPGITVETRIGTMDLDGAAASLVDLPGTYSTAPRSDDEGLAVRGFLGLLTPGERPDLVLCVVDGTSLERNLYLALTLRELGLPTVVAVTMTDTLGDEGGTLDTGALSSALGCPVFAASGLRADEITALRRGLAHALRERPSSSIAPPSIAIPAVALEAARAIRGALPIAASDEAVALLLAAVALADGAAMLGLDVGTTARVARLRDVPGVDVAVGAAVRARYETAGALARRAVHTVPDPPHERRTARIDAVALHPVLGPLAFFVVFGVLFQALFSWSAPLMDAIDALIGAVGGLVGPRLPDELPLVRSLVVNGVVAGVGNVLVFIPQIAFLFLFLGILDDTGYLARAAFLLDRLMARVGLHGRAFVPLLSGFACAVPALLATRTIENEKDRLVTILVTPLVSCSARLPVYSLMVAALFSSVPPLFGVVEVGVVLFFAMYTLSVVAAIGMAALFKRSILKSPTPPLVLELPPYRLPRPGQLLRHVGSRVAVFITDAGTVILGVTIILWALFTFPRDDALEARITGDQATLDAATLDDDAREEAQAALDARAGRERLEQSAGGVLGRVVEPLLAPLGFDWKLSVGVIASFAAREVLVSTLGLVYGLGDGTDEESVSLRAAMQHDVDEVSGRPRFTPLVGLSVMVFFVLAMQCMSTLATTRRETRSWKWPAFQLGYMTALAYVASLLVFQVGKLVGLA